MNPVYFVLLVEELKTKYLIKDICQILQIPLANYYRWKKKDFAQSSLEKKEDIYVKHISSLMVIEKSPH